MSALRTALVKSAPQGPSLKPYLRELLLRTPSEILLLINKRILMRTTTKDIYLLHNPAPSPTGFDDGHLNNSCSIALGAFVLRPRIARAKILLKACCTEIEFSWTELG